MTAMARSSKRLKGIYLAALILMTPFSAMAGKVEIAGGAYSFSATNSRNNSTSSISGIGSYRAGYRHTILDRYEFDIGYSLLATDAIGGDLSFGFDLGFNYFPVTGTGDIFAQTSNAYVMLQHVWRPFFGVSFNQRNFQSTSAQYAGLGVKAGVEYQWNEQLSLTGAFRYILLTGPNQSTADQMDLTAGFLVQF